MSNYAVDAMRRIAEAKEAEVLPDAEDYTRLLNYLSVALGPAGKWQALDDSVPDNDPRHVRRHLLSAFSAAYDWRERG